MPERETLRPKNASAWRRWLEKNHATSTGVYLVLGKKSAPTDAFRYDEALEEALCFGWIDSKVQGLDDHHVLQLFTPRKPKSVWSKRNKGYLARLEREGRMAPAGLAAIERAKQNGSWTALDRAEAGLVPDDLAAALAKNTKAQSNFAAFPPSAKRGYIYWVESAKRPETRAKRVRETVQLAAKNQKSRL